MTYGQLHLLDFGRGRGLVMIGASETVLMDLLESISFSFDVIESVEGFTSPPLPSSFLAPKENVALLLEDRLDDPKENIPLGLAAKKKIVHADFVHNGSKARSYPMSRTARHFQR